MVRVKHVIALIFCLLLTSIPKAQDASLYGLWQYLDPTIDAQGFYLGLYPDIFDIRFFEGSAQGRLDATNTSISLVGQTEYVQSTPYRESYGYQLNGDQLILTGQDGSVKTLYRVAPFVQTSQYCSGTIPSQMNIGYLGHVTYTDGTQTRLRSDASTSSQVLESLYEGEMFAVVGGPVCADGYTWWQLKVMGRGNLVGWSAEGSDYYFIEPDYGIMAAIEYQQTVSPTSSPSIQCPTWPTNLYVGALANVVHIGGLFSLQAFTEPSQYSDYVGTYHQGMTMHVVDGPVCSENAIWWKVEPFWEYTYGEPAWTIETIHGARYMVRITADPSDDSAVYDPLFALQDVGWFIEPMVPLRVYTQPDGNSSVEIVIWPGTAYEVYSQNADASMYQVWTPAGAGWVCNHPDYIRYNDHFLRVPIESNTTFECGYDQLEFDIEDAFVVAGAQTYQPGQYQYADEVEQLVQNTPNASGLVNMVSTVLFVKDVYDQNANRYDLVCAFADIVATEDNPEPQALCLIYDIGKTILVGEPIVGLPFIMAEITANPQIYIDPWLNDVNAFVNTMPMTRLYCYFNDCG